MPRTSPTKSLNLSEFQYFVMQGKLKLKSTILKISRIFIVHNNNSEKLLTNWPKKNVTNN